MKLTIILRSDASTIMCGDSPTYRSVTFDLTPQQVGNIGIRIDYTLGDKVYYESISKCFIEPDSEPPKCKYDDPACPCQDGDTCHYEGQNPWPIPASVGGSK